MSSKNLNELAEVLVNLTVKEVSELAKILEEQYNIKPAAATAIVAAGNAGSADAAAAPAQTEFNVVLKFGGQSKLAVVKLVKEITGLGLKEAKDLVDAAPKPVVEKVNKAKAEEVKAMLEEAGAEVVIE